MALTIVILALNGNGRTNVSLFTATLGLRFSFALTFPKNSCLIVRIQTYLQSTRPIIEQYEKQGKVRTIDASRSVDEV